MRHAGWLCMPCLALVLGCPEEKPDDGAQETGVAGDTGDSQPVDADDDGYAEDEDCDDGDSGVNPGAVEVCDGIDNDCDGATDEADAADAGTWYADADSDAYGNQAVSVVDCDQPAGYVSDDNDCDDTDETVHPGAEETCDGVDNDCDGDEASCEYGGEMDIAKARAKHWGAADEDAGRLVDVGDIDGDGWQDVVVATLYADDRQGGGYVVHGPLSGVSSLGVAGHQINGSSVTRGAGRSIGTGDADGDGFEDVIFGAPWLSPGSAWVVFGPVSDDVELHTAGAVLTGGHGTGHGSDLGDVNGDGVADAVIGAYDNDDGGNASGTVYVEYGPLSGAVTLTSEADASLIGQSAGDYTGRAIRAGVDVDGDGVGDMLIPASGSGYGGGSSGAAYVVYGPVTGTMDLESADVFMVGERASDYAGIALAMGDFNGDGLGDVAVGSYGNAAGTNAGAAYLVFGPGLASMDLGSADMIVRGSGGSLTGSGLAIGDVNGDEALELLVGTPLESSNGACAGAAHLFYGPMSGTYGITDSQAWVYGESAADTAGQGLAIGDLDGDGWGELLIGAPGEATGGSGAGAVYVLTPGG